MESSVIQKGSVASARVGSVSYISKVDPLVKDFCLHFSGLDFSPMISSALQLDELQGLYKGSEINKVSRSSGYQI